MSVKGMLEDVGTLAIVIVVSGGIGGVHGYKMGVAHDASKVSAAQLATATADANVHTLQATLTAVRQQLDVQKQALLTAEHAGAVALAQRDSQHAALVKSEAQRIQIDRKIANETSDGAALAHMPVPTALAVRLFGAAQPATAATTDTAGH